MSYDSWKTTNPDDQFLGPEPEDEEPSSKTPGQCAYERFWQEHLPANIEGTGWERLDPLMRMAWESVARSLK